MSSFSKTHDMFIAHFVGIFRCDFSGFEGLPDLICDDISLYSLPVIS